jgi:hypothetical protein
MLLFSKKSTLPLLGMLALLALQGLWLHQAYQLTYVQFLTTTNEAFDEACQKEQTYRIPVTDIINPGALTIQSCANEEVRIIRKCPSPDTIFFDNVSGQSLETFISRAFYELRESIIPLNLYCLSDLFAGALHDRDIPLSFTIERFNTATGKTLETTEPAVHKGLPTLSTHTLITNISATEGLRANLHFTNTAVFRRMTGVLIVSTCLLLLTLAGFGSLWLRRRRQPSPNTAPAPKETPTPPSGKIFHLGHYCFDSEKNELQGFGETLQLNKKENAILEALCMENGNIVERSWLLEQHWGSAGAIYTRSLDTYIAKLRKYLKADAAVQRITIKSQGYKLVGCEPLSATHVEF